MVATQQLNPCANRGFSLQFGGYDRPPNLAVVAESINQMLSRVAGRAVESVAAADLGFDLRLVIYGGQEQ